MRKLPLLLLALVVPATLAAAPPVKAQITGTNKSDHLVGTGSGETISGGRGADWIEGAGGNDTLTGGPDRDTFVWRANTGSDTVTDFETIPADPSKGTGPITVDRILVDYAGAYSDIVKLGCRFNGETINVTGNKGVATFTFAQDGANTIITASGAFFPVASLTLLNTQVGTICGVAFAGG